MAYNYAGLVIAALFWCFAGFCFFAWRLTARFSKWFYSALGTEQLVLKARTHRRNLRAMGFLTLLVGAGFAVAGFWMH